MTRPHANSRHFADEHSRGRFSTFRLFAMVGNVNQRLIALGGGLLSLVASHAALGQTAAERERLKELDAVCYEARGVKIREVQQQKIEQCVKEPPERRQARKSQEECERYWGDYGWVLRNKSGGARPHLFTDLPECVQASQARKQSQQRR